MWIQSLLIDGYECYNTNVKILNCEDLKSTPIAPKSNLTIAVWYFEDFKLASRRKVIEMKTDHFSQKFLLDIVVPVNAQQYAQKHMLYKAQTEPLRGIYAFINSFWKMCLVVYLIIYVWKTLLVRNRMSQDQIFYLNKMYPIIDPFNQIERVQNLKKEKPTNQQLQADAINQYMDESMLMDSYLMDHIMNPLLSQPDSDQTTLMKKHEDKVKDHIFYNISCNSVHNKRDFRNYFGTRFYSQT